MKGPRSAIRARLARVRLGLATTGVALLVGLGLLLARAIEAGERERALREQALIARVFDELEGTLATFVAAEQARPFVQWRHLWVAPGSSESRSPLATLQAQRPWLVGYFQIEPGGEFQSPMIPPEGEAALTPELRARVTLLRERVAEPTRLADAEPPAQQRNAAKQVQQQAALPQDIQIQRALDQQSNMRLNALVNDEPANAAPDDAQISSFLALTDPAQGLHPQSPPALAGELDLRVEPFGSRVLDDRYVELAREVWIGERRWRQGMLIDRAQLEDWLADQVLGSPELSAAIALDWRALDDLARVHEFAEPFAMLHVQAELRASFGEGEGQRFVILLGVLLALALIGLLIAVDRTLATLVSRAEERERFIAAVTHELRTPLTSIRMYSEMLEQGMVAEPTRQTSYHRTIRGEAERLSRLVEQVLTLARLDQAAAAPRVDEPAPISTIVERVIELLEPQAAAKQLTLVSTIAEPQRARSLPSDALTQVLTNLLDNAIKFSPPGAGPITLQVEGVGRRVRLVVADHGPGVEPGLIERIFDPFVRGRAAEADATPGTGIGLAVVRSLVSELGGTIVARPREGGGLEFVVELDAGA